MTDPTARKRAQDYNGRGSYIGPDPCEWCRREPATVNFVITGAHGEPLASRACTECASPPPRHRWPS